MTSRPIEAEPKTPSIASVTVAYNGAAILPLQLNALLRQSCPLQEIIVVDNNSTDGTLEMLAKEFPQVTVIRLAKNVGAAGGSAKGWQYAIERGHNWVWNFDHDSVPDDQALEALLQGYEQAGDATGLVVPLPVDVKSGASYPPLWWRDGLVRPDAETLDKDIWFADAAVASGALIRRDVITTIGFHREEFFMDFFDFDYCLRARAAGFQIAVIKACQFAHEIGNSKTVRFLGKSRTWPVQGAWREYYIGRNVTYTVFWLYSTLRARIWLAGYLLRHAGAILAFGDDKRRALAMFLRGIIDGIRGKLGIRFLPGQ